MLNNSLLPITIMTTQKTEFFANLKAERTMSNTHYSI